MGLRLQRRVKLLPGVHLNVSLSGVGVSVGGRGAHIRVTPAASATPASACLARAFPGASTTSQRRPRRGVTFAPPGNVHFPAWLALVIVLTIVIAVIGLQRHLKA